MEAVMQFPWVAPRKILSFGYRGGTLALCLVLATAIIGCGSFASFVAAAEEDIPVIEQMVTNITNIIAPGVSVDIQAAGNLAIAGLQILCGSPAPGAKVCDASSVVGTLQGDPTNQTLLQRVQSLLADINGHISAMLALAKGLAPGIGAAIVTVIGVALQTVTLLLSIIPPAVLFVKNGKFSKTLAIGLKNMPRAKVIKAQFNQSVIDAGYPQAAIA